MRNLIYLFLFLAVPVFAQDLALTYEPTTEGSYIIIRDLSETSDDHLIVGYDYHSSPTDPPVAGIMKTDLAGEVQWSKTLDISESIADCSFEVIEKADGNYYFWGLSKEGGTLNMRAILSEITPDGDMLWSKEYDFGPAIESSYTVNKLQVLPSGDLQMMIAIVDRVIVLKTDASGEIIWGKASSIEGPGIGGKNPGFEWLAFPEDGGMCASKAGSNFSLLRYSEDGELLWNKAYEIGGYTHGKTLVKSPNGNVLVAGFINNTAHIMEVDDETGEINWIKRFDDKLMVLESASHLHVVGEDVILDFTTSDNEQYVVKLNADGEVLTTLYGKNEIFDYNKIELTDHKDYFYGGILEDGAHVGFINISNDLMEGTCLLEKVPLLTTSAYTAFEELEFDPGEEDFTSEAEIAVSLEDFTVQMRFLCENVLTVDNEVFSKLTVYPNPASDQLRLAISKELVNSSYTITDISGKVVVENEANSTQVDIDISDLQPGQYILMIKKDDQWIAKKVSIIE